MAKRGDKKRKKILETKYRRKMARRVLQRMMGTEAPKITISNHRPIVNFDCHSQQLRDSEIKIRDSEIKRIKNDS